MGARRDYAPTQTKERAEGAWGLAQSESALRDRRESSKANFSGWQVFDSRNFTISDSHKPNYERTMPAPFVDPADHAVDGANAFVNSGINLTKTLSEISTINGVAIARLNELAKGTHHTTGNPHNSEAGFIHSNQDLRNILITDNVVVTEQHQLTHQVVASPLLHAMKALEVHGIAMSFRMAPEKIAASFLFQGSEYFIELVAMGGSNGSTSNQVRSGWVPQDTQGSFFNDSIYANYEFVITRGSDGKRLTGDALTPHLIYRYGFYQGGGYRLPPNKIIEFFSLTP